MSDKFPTYTLSIFVAIFGLILPRLFLIGGYPRGDEGFYATIALLQNVVPGSDSGTFSLYSRLASFIFYLEGNHILFLRLLDLSIASFAAILMFLVAKRLISARWVAFLTTIIFLIVMNQAIFIHRGFANPIYVSYVFFFGALIFIINEEKSKLFHKTFIVGVIVGLAVLFREQFVLFASAVGFYFLVRSGFKFALAYAFGGFVSLTILIICLNLIGVSTQTIISSYLDMSSIYSELRSDHSNWNALVIFIQRTWPLILFVFIVNFIYIYKLSSRSRLKELWRSKWLFFLIISLIPLIETLVKYSVPYTFALSLPGLLFGTLIALNFLFENSSEKFKNIVLGVLATLLVYFGLHLFFNAPHKILWGGNFVGWTSSGFESDVYLKAAQSVSRLSREGDTIAMTGDLYPIFPLTLRAPINFDMADLDRTVVQFGLNAEQMSELLKQCSPDIIFLSTAFPKTSSIVANAIDLTNIYNLVERIESSSIDFGQSGAFIFRLNDELYKLKTEKYCKKNIKNYLTNKLALAR